MPCSCAVPLPRALSLELNGAFPVVWQSRNCMRELVRSVATGKPLIAVAERDPDHGGLSEAKARQQCLGCADDLDSWGLDSSISAAALTDVLLGTENAAQAAPHATRLDAAASNGRPIVYERVGAFQQTMLRLIVQRLVPERELYLPGELGSGRRPPLAPPSGRFHVWCSRHNPGAFELLDELKSFGGWEGKLLVTDEPAQMQEADQLLLLLNRATWADDARRVALTAEVRGALMRTPRRPLLLVHETDEGRGGVAAFSHFFGPNVTPPELLQLKVYAEIAVPMKEGAYRAVSRAMAASTFGQGGTGGTGTLGRLASGVAARRRRAVSCVGQERAVLAPEWASAALSSRSARGRPALRSHI